MTTLTYLDPSSGGTNDDMTLLTIGTPSNETVAQAVVNCRNEQDIGNAIASHFTKIKEMKEYTTHYVMIETNYGGKSFADYFARRVKAALPRVHIMYFEATKKSKITLTTDGSLTIKT